MLLKWIGAGLILAGCGGFGCSLAYGYRREEGLLRGLLHTLCWMECELRYHLTPLPDLCRQAAQQAPGSIRQVLSALALALEGQAAADAQGCMRIVLEQTSGLPVRVKHLLGLLGSGLGRFDLSGQLEGLQEVAALCKEELAELSSGREERLKSYRTLSLCAGAALVILFI